MTPREAGEGDRGSPGGEPANLYGARFPGNHSRGVRGKDQERHDLPGKAEGRGKGAGMRKERVRGKRREQARDVSTTPRGE